MSKNERAGYGGDRSGLYQNFIVGGKPKGFDAFNYRKNAPFGQCQKCGSDYMKFSVNGFCQDCQQRCEFITREHPHIVREIKNQRRGTAL